MYDIDIDYMAAQIQDHQRTANLLLWHVGSGQNEPLRKYSMEMLPKVMNYSNRQPISSWEVGCRSPALTP